MHNFNAYLAYLSEARIDGAWFDPAVLPYLCRTPPHFRSPLINTNTSGNGYTTLLKGWLVCGYGVRRQRTVITEFEEPARTYHLDAWKSTMKPPRWEKKAQGPCLFITDIISSCFSSHPDIHLTSADSMCVILNASGTAKNFTWLYKPRSFCHAP